MAGKSGDDGEENDDESWNENGEINHFLLTHASLEIHLMITILHFYVDYFPVKYEYRTKRGKLT